MYGNKQNYQVQGYQPHPGAATYYHPEAYMYPCGAGAIGGYDYSMQPEGFDANNYQNNPSTDSLTSIPISQFSESKEQQTHHYSKSSTFNYEQPVSNNQRFNKTEMGMHEHRGARPKQGYSSHRGNYRGNNRVKNYEEPRENYQSHNNNHQSQNVVYGRGYYKNKYINKVRNLRTERQQADQPDIMEELPEKERYPSQRGTNKNSFLRGNGRQYPNNYYNYSNNTYETNTSRRSESSKNYEINYSRRSESSKNYETNSSRKSEQSKKYENNFSRRSELGINSSKNKSNNEKMFNRRMKYGQNEVIIDDRQQKTMQLRSGIYECLTCFEKMAQIDSIWSCQTCYNSFHLDCVKLWIKNSIKDETWRCPACNSAQTETKVKYYCFCKKVLNPYWKRKEMPHSCGQLCKKKRNPSWCIHACPDLCHPGSCPPCAAFLKRKCACGKLEKSLRCSDMQDLLCDNMCDKMLNCGVHHCKQPCHTNDCLPCDNTCDKSCYCGKNKTTEICTAENVASNQYSCEEICKKTLSCTFHSCQRVCHSEDCTTCNRAIALVTHCPCGKKSLIDMEGPPRESCVDPIPTCGEICGKNLKCGNPGNFHICQVPCHEGPCPVCPKVTPVKCRCGSMNSNIPCSELTVKADEVTCKKPCKKLRHCGRHKCALKCCIDGDHLCTRTCNQFLSCKNHRCEQLCHRGKCKRCLRSSFDELTCHCGYSIMNPPVPCGATPPACDQPCVRPQGCEHLPTHKCHEGVCPPCTMLVPKACCGNHKTMKNTPCYVSSLSCGLLCGKTINCGVHKCQKVCHEGECQPEKTCVQSCTKPREMCRHPCSSKCHKGPCPNSSCKVMIIIQCICGTRKANIQCAQNEKEFQAMVAAQLASQMQNTGKSVDLTALFSNTNNSDKLKRLECDNECKLKERNQRLALALQITNPESRDKLGDTNHLYSEQMKEDAKRDLQFTTMVHDMLNDLVIRARESTQKNRSYSFAPMNRDKRRLIHEYSKHFGCESKAYDEEPKKNVVVTASRGLCYLPPVSILTIIQREAGNRIVPAPYLNKIPKVNNEMSFKKLEKSNSQENKDEEAASKPFDYFDME